MTYDVAIIGAGWAGFNAALRAKALGLTVALIEKSDIGGTCLNRGCIPTKALIHSAKIYTLAKKAPLFGVSCAAPAFDFTAVQARKNKIVQQLRSGMQFLVKGIDLFNEPAQIISPVRIQAGSRAIDTKTIIVATGSRPYELKGFAFDAKKIISSDQVLALTDVPRSLLIIGGGVIGCEFACLFANFGAQVAVVEKMPQLLPGEDKEVARKLESALRKKGIKVSTATDAASVTLTDYELVLVCVGRAAYTAGLGLEELGVSLAQGKIIVDDYLKTTVANIYAAGDCTGKTMLAHFAAYQGQIAAENIAHPQAPVAAGGAHIPSCIFTDPEIASVGLNEDAARGKGIEITVKKFDFLGSGMARIIEEADGFIKIVCEAAGGKVLGASIIGPRATELIASLGVAVANGLTAGQLKNTIFAHPTLSEAIPEALKDI
ncbi:MAG TPA: dihydrolipoyl dehydrogenase [Patescibacteria group bacterium]|nr:dihydrolipoyl dehydrogenase [Patescibacteria group bacterium]